MLDFADFREEFISQCRSDLCAFGPEAMWIEEHPVNKSQRGMLNGIIFMKEGLNCAPTLYVEDFYDSYREGSSIRTLSHDAIEAVIRGMDMAGFLSDRTEDFISDDKNLRVRLINKKLNKEYLKDIPAEDVGGGFVFIAEIEYGEFRTVINDELLNSMDVSKEELFETALNNTVRAYPAKLFDLGSSVSGVNDENENLLTSESKYAPAGAGPGFVLTNSRYFWGAGALFYPGVIERIHELLDDDFYVLPSSVHEFIIVEASGQDPECLARMVREANRTVVDVKDILADDLYICEAGKFRRVSYGGEVREGMADYLN